MLTDSSVPITWPQLLAHLEQQWRRPAADFLPDLLGHIRHDVIALIEPVMVGAKMLVSFYALSPDQQVQLQHCGQIADEWLLNCRMASDECLARQLDPSATCEAYLQALGPIFNNSAGLLASLTTLEATESLEPEIRDVLSTMQKGLRRLGQITIGHDQSDLTWLKEIFDEQERKRQRSK